MGNSSDIQQPPAGEQKRAGLSLSKKITLIMLLVSLVPLGTLWTINFFNAGSQIKNDTARQFTEISNGLGTQVNGWVDKNFRVLNTCARLSSVTGMEQAQQEEVLKHIQQEYPWMYLVFTVDLAGMNVARSDGKKLKDYSDRQYYKDIINGKTHSWQTLIGKTSKKPALVLAVPIREEGKLVGVFASAMTIRDISDKVAGWKRGNTGAAFLVDEKNTVIAHPNSKLVLSREDLSRHPLVQPFRTNPRQGIVHFKDPYGFKYLGYVQEVNYGWALAIFQEEREVFAELRKMQTFTLILFLATILLVIVVSWWGARKLVNPIVTLTRAAEKMSLGDIDISIDVDSKDEIGSLAEAIKRMQISLKMAMERLRKK